jgi:hypothetical protein
MLVMTLITIYMFADKQEGFLVSPDIFAGIAAGITLLVLYKLFD